MRIAIIGAGSGFGATLSRDILSQPSLRAACIALCDIDERKLTNAKRYVERVIETHGLPATVEGHLDRRAALAGADFVITSISAGGPAYHGFPANVETNIPNRYGLSQSIADTIGVGGVFRFLRTAPIQVGVCRDMEDLCPRALMLNYTNPMCMLTWAHSAASSIRNVGLCHSVQGTAGELSRYLGVPCDEVRYHVAGINHQAWFLKLTRNGEDLYPALRAKLDDPDTVARDRIRFEMFRHFGYFVTESSTHCSEYHPYFRRNADLMAHYQLSERVVADTGGGDRQWLEAPDEVEIPALTPSNEYASRIIEAVVSGGPYEFNGNVMNTGLIPNLPDGCCVEVPCLVDGAGVHATCPGPLPAQLAHLNASNVAVQELAVRAFLDKDKEAAFHACAMDPLTRATLSLDQIRDLFEELWTAEATLLGYFAG